MATSSWEYYGEPDPFELAAAETFFFQIATAAHEHFAALPAFDDAIQFVPLRAGGKTPAKGFRPSEHTDDPKSREALALVALAANHQDSNLGIGSRRAVGAIIVIDCDEPGVVERIERETGRTLPLTFTTQTRPHSAPHKMHLVYMSTERSVLRLPKQVTNVTHTAGYDLKGNGGWGYVRAAGSVCEGETVTVLHDVPIAPIPDWLVDFLVPDVAKARSQERKRKLAANKPKPAEPEPTSPRYFVVPRQRRTYAIKSRARSMKNLGMSDERIVPELLDHTRDYFEDGERLAADRAYVRKVRSMVREVPTLGARAYSNLLRDRGSKHKSPLRRIREQIETAPDRLTSAEARQLLDVHTHADEQRMFRQLRRARYVLLGPQGSHDRVWVRLRPPASVHVPQHSSLSLTAYSPFSTLSPNRAVVAQAAGTATPSESESEKFPARQVVARQGIADGGLTLTFEKDGRSEKFSQRTETRATDGKNSANAGAA